MNTTTKKVANSPVITAQTNLARIDDNISKIRRQISATDDDIQSTILMIVMHGQRFGDVTRAAKLVSTLDKARTYRASVIVAYFMENTTIRLMKQKGEWKASLKPAAIKDDNGQEIPNPDYKTWDQSLFTVGKVKDDKGNETDTWQSPFWMSDAAQRGDPALFNFDNAKEGLANLIIKLERKIKPVKKIVNGKTVESIDAEPADVLRIQAVIGQLREVDKKVKAGEFDNLQKQADTGTDTTLVEADADLAENTDAPVLQTGTNG